MPDADNHTPYDRARESLTHLQAAAREVIEAARAMLDVAEDVVNDPETVASIAESFGGTGSLADAFRRWCGPLPPRPRTAGPATTGDADSGPPGEPGVERITVQ